MLIAFLQGNSHLSLIRAQVEVENAESKMRELGFPRLVGPTWANPQNLGPLSWKTHRKMHHLKMYFLSKNNGNFPIMLVFRGVSSLNTSSRQGWTFANIFLILVSLPSQIGTWDQGRIVAFHRVFSALQIRCTKKLQGGQWGCIEHVVYTHVFVYFFYVVYISIYFTHVLILIISYIDMKISLHVRK